MYKNLFHSSGRGCAKLWKEKENLLLSITMIVSFLCMVNHEGKTSEMNKMGGTTKEHAMQRFWIRKWTVIQIQEPKCRLHMKIAVVVEGSSGHNSRRGVPLLVGSHDGRRGVLLLVVGDRWVGMWLVRACYDGECVMGLFGTKFQTIDTVKRHVTQNKNIWHGKVNIYWLAAIYVITNNHVFFLFSQIICDN